MMTEKVRNALGAFAMLVIVAGLGFGLIALVAVAGADRVSGRTFGSALGSIIQFVFVSTVGGGILRVLVSIDARLEQRA